MISFTNKTPLTFRESIEREKILYERLKIPPLKKPQKINEKKVLNRHKEIFQDSSFNFPQTIFLISKDGFPTIVGRKIMSELYIENKINAPHCSQLAPSMLLGFLHSKNSSKSKIMIEYYPFTHGEKLYIFNLIAQDRLADIHFPFPYIDFATNKEKQCAPTGWSINPQKVQNLSNGEKHFRDYTTDFFQEIIKKEHIIFDPACSTGEFLLSIKQKFPGCKTIGQDLSSEMTEYAKNNVDEIYTGDAINSPVPRSSVDIMFLRFLNSEIVTSNKALQMFNTLVAKVKTKGLIVLFGHTPVLLNRAQLIAKNNLELLNTNGYNPQNNSIFQYYVLKKK